MCVWGDGGCVSELGVGDRGLLGKSCLTLVGLRAVVRQVKYHVSRVVHPGRHFSSSASTASHLVGSVFLAGPTGICVLSHFHCVLV